MSARNAIAAEMSMAGRAGHHPGDGCWDAARDALLSPGEATWILASDAYAQMREDLACDGPTPAEALGGHGAALAALAVAVGGRARGHDADAERPSDHPPVRKPAARRRREWLATAGWFALGGFGGLLLAAAVRTLEVMFAWH
jgi:hypothetical protein